MADVWYRIILLGSNNTFIHETANGHWTGNRQPASLKAQIQMKIFHHACSIYSLFTLADQV